MGKLSSVIMFLALCSCGHPPIRGNHSVSEDPELKTKFDTYKELSLNYEGRDSYGMFSQEGSIGDSILFSCLHQYATGVKIDSLASFSPQGYPLRHPDITPEVSATPISRDMIIGFLMCALSDPENGLEITKRIIRAGTKNNWDLCGSACEYEIGIATRLGRCVMSPALIGTIYRVKSALGGDCDLGCDLAKKIPRAISSSVTGFSRHLAVLHILIAGVTGGITKKELKKLEKFAVAEPNNALYQAVYNRFMPHGQQFYAANLLLDSSRFPMDALPTSENYCTPYLYQRDESPKDWGSCDEGKVHSGTDFLLAARIALWAY